MGIGYEIGDAYMSIRTPARSLLPQIWEPMAATRVVCARSRSSTASSSRTSSGSRARPTDKTATPPTLIAFDCLFTRGKDVRKRPLRVRRNVLEDLVAGHALVLPARRLADDGFEAWAQVLERGYEELVGKDEASPYVEGRTLSWLKVKVSKYREVERGFYKPE